MTPNFGSCFIQSLDDAILYYSFYIPLYLTLSMCVTGVTTLRLSIFIYGRMSNCVSFPYNRQSGNYFQFQFQSNTHFGQANDANESSTPGKLVEFNASVDSGFEL